MQPRLSTWTRCMLTALSLWPTAPPAPHNRMPARTWRGPIAMRYSAAARTCFSRRTYCDKGLLRGLCGLRLPAARHRRKWRLRVTRFAPVSEAAGRSP